MTFILITFGSVICIAGILFWMLRVIGIENERIAQQIKQEIAWSGPSPDKDEWLFERQAEPLERLQRAS